MPQQPTDAKVIDLVSLNQTRRRLAKCMLVMASFYLLWFSAVVASSFLNRKSADVAFDLLAGFGIVSFILFAAIALLYLAAIAKKLGMHPVKIAILIVPAVHPVVFAASAWIICIQTRRAFLAQGVQPGLGWASAKELNRPRVPHCRSCEYDLTGLDQSQPCPECGAPRI